MAGMGLGLGGGVRLGPALSAPAATITSTVYGAESAPTDALAGGLQTWHLAVMVPVAGLAFLAFLRWSLPK